jgi:hypothetical protein
MGDDHVGATKYKKLALFSERDKSFSHVGFRLDEEKDFYREVVNEHSLDGIKFLGFESRWQNGRFEPWFDPVRALNGLINVEQRDEEPWIKYVRAKSLALNVFYCKEPLARDIVARANELPLTQEVRDYVSREYPALRSYLESPVDADLAARVWFGYESAETISEFSQLGQNKLFKLADSGAFKKYVADGLSRGSSWTRQLVFTQPKWRSKKEQFLHN